MKYCLKSFEIPHKDILAIEWPGNIGITSFSLIHLQMKNYYISVFFNASIMCCSIREFLKFVYLVFTLSRSDFSLSLIQMFSCFVPGEIYWTKCATWTRIGCVSSTLQPTWKDTGSGEGSRIYSTHWGRDKMAAISQTTLSNPFSWMKMFELRITFHWSLLLWFQLTIFQHWFR